MAKLILKNFQLQEITAYKKWLVTLLSKNGVTYPYQGVINVFKNEIPFPIIIDFGSGLPNNTKVYATIDGINERELYLLNTNEGKYQLDFLPCDFNKIGRKKLNIKIVNGDIIEYIQEKFEFNVKNLEC